MINFVLCSNVDAARGGTDDQKLGMIFDPFGDHYLLAVAAAQAGDVGQFGGRLDSEFPDCFACCFPLLSIIPARDIAVRLADEIFHTES